MKSITELTDTARVPTLGQCIEDYITMWRNAKHSSGRYPMGQWALDAFVQTIAMDPHKVEEYFISTLLLSCCTGCLPRLLNLPRSDVARALFILLIPS